jgi:hypothetical protein
MGGVGVARIAREASFIWKSDNAKEGTFAVKIEFNEDDEADHIVAAMSKALKMMTQRIMKAGLTSEHPQVRVLGGDIYIVRPEVINLSGKNGSQEVISEEQIKILRYG